MRLAGLNHNYWWMIRWFELILANNSLWGNQAGTKTWFEFRCQGDKQSEDGVDKVL